LVSLPLKMQEDLEGSSDDEDEEDDDSKKVRGEGDALSTLTRDEIEWAAETHFNLSEDEDMDIGADQALELGTTGRWKEGLVARAASAAQKKVNLMQLVYGRSPGNSLQQQDDSDESDDDDLFRPRQNSHKVDLVSDYLQPVFWLIL
jgi:hypothetical protein